MIKLKTTKDIELLRESGRRLADVLRQVKSRVAPGVTTIELDDFAFELIKNYGDKPAFRGYRPAGSRLAYPTTLCVSVDEEIVHGIPSKRILKEGEIVSLDCGLNHEGYFSDHAVTVGVGKIADNLKTLLAVTEEALYAGIKLAKPGKYLGDIGWAIEQLARQHHYGLVEELCGHGVGFAPHEDPYVPNYGQPGQGLVLKPGLVIAIEPMFALGTGEITFNRDGFSFSTKDGKAAAHFEHTVAVTDKGPEILTK